MTTNTMSRAVVEWELHQQGLDLANPHVSQALEDLVPDEGLDEDGDWEAVWVAAWQHANPEEVPGRRAFEAVLADCPDHIKYGAPPVAEHPPTEVPSGEISPSHKGEEPAHYTPAPPPEHTEEPHDEDSRPTRHTGETTPATTSSNWWLIAGVIGAVGIGVALLLLLGTSLLEEDTRQADNAKPPPSNAVTVNDAPPDKEVKSSPESPTPGPAPAPQEPSPVQPKTTPAPETPKPPVVQPETSPKPVADNLTVTCDVYHDLLGACQAPGNCMVEPGLFPRVRATCGGEQFCSQRGGLTLPLGKGKSIQLGKEWCDS